MYGTGITVFAGCGMHQCQLRHCSGWDITIPPSVFLDYLKGILKSKNDSFQIMYGIRGERELTETDLPHLAGYENSKPVRIGNAAFSQRQNDVFGYLLNIIYQYYDIFPRNIG